MSTQFATQGNVMPTCQSLVEMTVDKNNIIVAVNASWDEFALSNDAPQLAGGSVIGWSLLDSVSGKVTKIFTQALLDLARSHEQKIMFDYRCDSPQVRRFMRMHISQGDAGSVQFIHEHLSSEYFSHAAIYQSAAQRSRDTLVRCSICNHVRHDGIWSTPDYVSRTFFASHPVSVIYGICPSCQGFL
jgi:hypothetical protein